MGCSVYVYTSVGWAGYLKTGWRSNEASKTDFFREMKRC